MFGYEEEEYGRNLNANACLHEAAHSKYNETFANKSDLSKKGQLKYCLIVIIRHIFVNIAGLDRILHTNIAFVSLAALV